MKLELFSNSQFSCAAAFTNLNAFVITGGNTTRYNFFLVIALASEKQSSQGSSERGSCLGRWFLESAKIDKFLTYKYKN
jgi:hypothetical protein